MDKIFELRIEEDDDISGIDSISLVSEPAIDVNWIAFNKEKPQEFHIPEGEDQKYLDLLMSKGQSEEELFADGWELDTEDFISSSPNSPSEEDTKQYLIRYKYILNPKASGAPVKSTTRAFCKDLLAKNFVFRVEDILNITNDQGSSAADWRGGYNCRHLWQQIKYKKDTKIINKGSVTKGRVDGGESLEILGYTQNDTRVPAHPSFSKESFDKISIDYDDTLSTARGKDIARNLIKQGNDVIVITRRQESDLGPVYQAAKDLGIPRDKVYATNGKLKWETIKRLGVQKHIDNNPDELKAIKENLPDVKTEQFDYDVTGLPVYKDPGLLRTGKTENRYAEVFDDFKGELKQSQRFATDTEKHIVLGPAMIPDMKIFRKDNQGNPYYVFFSADTIKMICEKYMKNKFIDNNDLEHDGQAASDVYVFESWIKESMDYDKGNAYGFSDLPVGTWFVSMKINNPKVWEDIKNKTLNGFSVSGFFEEVAQFCREEMFLKEVAKIIKNIKE